MDLKQARQKKADLLKQATAIHDKANAEKRPMTEEEMKLDDDLFAQITQTSDEIRRMERILEEERSMVSVRDANTEAQNRGETEARVRAFDPAKPFKSFGEQMMAIWRAGDPNQRIIDPRLNAVGVASGLSEGVPSDGGFLLQPEYAAGLLRRTYEMGAISSRVRRLPIGANSNSLRINAIDERSRVDGSRWGGVLAYWTNEADQKTGSKPKFRQMELALQKLTALCYATDELLQDATALESVLQEAFPEELNFRVEDAILEGTGAGMPQGILSSAAKITVPGEVAQPAGTIVWENIKNMWTRMWARSRMNAVWLINQDCEPSLYSMAQVVGVGGVPVYLPATGAAGAPYSTLMGRPVIPVEYCSTVGTEGDIMLLDLDQYLMIDKGGIQSASSIHVRFIYDETTFRFVYRVDGQPIWNVPLTPFKGVNTKSPFITLATR